MRIVLNEEPFDRPNDGWSEAAVWPASWITHPELGSVSPVILGFHRSLVITEARVLRIHVSADQRYELYLDGSLMGRGPERCDPKFWRFETYELDLSAGEHTLFARVAWLGDIAAMAQMTLRPGFLLAAEEDGDAALFNTGRAEWKVKRLGGYSMRLESEEHCGANSFAGPSYTLDGSELDWVLDPRSKFEGWVAPLILTPGRNESAAWENVYGWTLKPASLPAMLNVRCQIGTARHVDNSPATSVSESDIVDSARHLAIEASEWDALLAGRGSGIVVPANTRRRIIVDLKDYYCAYPEAVVSGGAGASVNVRWAEALYVPGTSRKDNRDVVEGREFIGYGDTFLPDGGLRRTFAPLWWRAGRYLQISIVTESEPLTIESIAFDETGYPFDVTCTMESSDARLADVARVAIRTIQTGSHETYMDCPFYEQLMYVGDTRIEALMTYIMTPDSRLPRKALELFDQSRSVKGLTASRYPSRHGQTIPPFSLFWIGMAHDYALWRDEGAFVKSLMPGVRSVIDAYFGFINADGLVQEPQGWNFMDWVPAWPGGVPPNGSKGVSSVLNWQFVYALKLAVDLERWFGDAHYADRYAEAIAALVPRLMEAFYDPLRCLFADDKDHAHWSEHAQCLALLSGELPPQVAQQVGEELCCAPNLERSTIYFTHYLFETYRQLRRIDLVFDRLALWFGLEAIGLKTTIEQPEPSRSDNHGWGAHPLFHYYTTLLGIRPTAPGFSEVTIDPQIGPLAFAAGSIPHPLGQIEMRVSREGDGYRGTIVLPDGLKGKLLLGDAGERDLQGGQQSF